ncbi:MAG TPA: T9SS type A sorting domain-containing protein [Ohtaekwangia sp.]|uniref:T9SS type A sorting domain-containing protein n=1 Tax=Ohtaekwangia sp. TaxID=2066019 RepID=UPI002F92A48F
MKGFYATIVFLIGLIGMSEQALCQSPGEDVLVTVVVSRAKSTYDAKGEAEDYRWKVRYNSPAADELCLKVENQGPNEWFSFNTTLVSLKAAKITDEIFLYGEGWEEDNCKSDCAYNNTTAGCDDNGHCSTGLGTVSGGPTSSAGGFRLSDYKPGVTHTIQIDYCNGSYTVEYQFTYYPPAPLAGKAAVNGVNCDGQICPDCTIKIPVSTSVNASFQSDLQYVWEYNVGGETTKVWVDNPAYCGDTDPDCASVITSTSGNNARQKKGGTISPTFVDPGKGGGGPAPACCNEPAFIQKSQTVWRSFGTTYGNQDGGAKTFTAADLQKVAGLTENTTINFRIKTVANGLASNTYGSATIMVSPPAPNATTVTIDPSCPGAVGTGALNVSGVTSQFSQYRYILKKGTYSALGCNPDQNGSCLSADDITGNASGSSFTISGVKAETYTLFLINSAGKYGFCSRLIGTYTVPAIPNLGVNPFTPQDLTCNGVNEGSFTALIHDGRYTTVHYDLLNQTTGTALSKTSSTANASATFDQLAPGTYRLNVNDQCTPDVISNFTITQPSKVSSTEFQKVNATCIDPGNGSAKITVSKTGSPDVEVSSIYHYQLYKEGTLYNEQFLTAATYTWTNLPVSSDYKILVKEKGGRDCNAATVNFVIDGPDPISASAPVVTDVTCFNGSDGTITIKGTGGTGSYVYDLTGTASQSNNTGTFTGLASGSYTVTIHNTITCNDKYISSAINVQQPTQVVATISKKDISCYGAGDGQITSAVSGGTPGSNGYSYTWETQISGSWTSLGKTTPTLTGLQDGTYRLNVKDEKQCPAISNEVTIIEPTAVDISGAQVTDIKCFGETGTIVVSATGGTGSYTYAYSLNNGSSFTTFNAATPLSAGIYLVKATDAHGCSDTDADKYTITSPSSALNFTETLSDYNGYNISCYGGGNGWATLTATGGNGATYSGYQYAFDNGAYQANQTMEGIYAGAHTFHVKDGRGCEVSKTVTFTQTADQLLAQLTEKKDVVCYGDATGILAFTGKGGLPPYQYSLDNAAFQDQGRFTGLSAGTYTVTVKDKNNCDNTSSTDIVSVNPPIQIKTVITDVSCYNGRDGAVETSVTGGVSPFQYQWKENGAITSSISALTIGTYTVKITDNAGCTMQASALVQQPLEPLSTSLAAVPVCYGRSNGSITVTTKGGTIPYAYSIDNGQSFQTDPIFIQGVGNYTVTTKDSKGCTVSAAATIVLRNDKPEPDFLVPSSRNAMDTIVITEVSVPKPDSIYWIFDPKAIVISNDGWSPEIRFAEAGTYFVGMTGYFGGCDYAQTRNITIKPYDPSIVKEKLPSYKPIQSVSVSPNPSSGQFDVSVTLAKKYNLSIIVYDVLGNRHYDNTWESIESLKETITLDDVSTGVYLLRVVTESDAQDVRLLINK